MNSKSLSQTTETLRSYVNPNQHFDVNYVRLRHNKVNISIFDIYMLIYFSSQVFQMKHLQNLHILF